MKTCTAALAAGRREEGRLPARLYRAYGVRSQIWNFPCRPVKKTYIVGISMENMFFFRSKLRQGAIIVKVGQLGRWGGKRKE